MPSEIFRAEVQYHDWKGTAAADNSDTHDIGKWLKDKNLIQEGEFLIGVKTFAGENHEGKHQDPIQVSALIVQQGDFDTVKQMIDKASGPVFVRKISFQIDALEFLGLFKRLSIAISRGNMLDGLEYEYL